MTAPRRRALRRVIVGRPMATGELEETLLPKWLALPIFASDPLSSNAYATEEALVVLVGASAVAAHLVFPIAIAIALLLAIVVLSYRQTVRAYETSGGAYVVARENLGVLPSLVSAGALLIDYILTVAVSISAGILAITSFAPSLASHKVGLSLACLLLIVLANLRGVRESGLLFALPTYAFIAALLALVVGGFIEIAAGHAHHAVVPNALPTGAGTLGTFVLLRAFSSGSTALTGVEAIANGVNAFRHPQGRNAATTLGVLGVVTITLFLGISYLAVRVHAAPSATASVVSQIGRAVYRPGTPFGFLFYVIQATTLLILVLAANTSFQGFPRLSALLASDRFFPRQFTNLGDRLVFSNGILFLAGIAALLVWVYKANVNNLIHLYVIGVFTAFTISQAGMVRYWRRVRTSGWRRRTVINALGASATGLVTAIVVYTKFGEGAWLVTVAVPVLVLAMLGTRRHYRRVARRLRAGAAAVAAAPQPRNTTLFLVESLDTATRKALWFVRSISGWDFRAVHVRGRDTDPGVRPRWFRLTDGKSNLEVLPGRDAEAVLDQVWRLPRGESDFVTVVIPELFSRRTLVAQLQRRLELSVKLRLLTEPGVVVVSVPAVEGDPEALPVKAAVRVLVSDVSASTMRAVNYAGTLGVHDTAAVHFAFSDSEAFEFGRAWADHGPRIELDVQSAPYRDLAQPLLRYLRQLTDDGETEVIVVMPELIVRGWRRLLHNQRALYLKRLLLFEPRVILASVPYQLLR